jgi:hypothetical protein
MPVMWIILLIHQEIASHNMFLPYCLFEGRSYRVQFTQFKCLASDISDNSQIKMWFPLILFLNLWQQALGHVFFI